MSSSERRGSAKPSSLVMNPDPVEVKIVVVGDGSVGKTCMIKCFSENEFPSGYTPTVFDQSKVSMKVGNQQVLASIFDTAGQSDYDRLRPLSYPNTDIFLVCFSVTQRDSLDNVFDLWIPELRHYTPGFKCILVGTKADLKSNGKHITTKECEDSVKKLRNICNCVKYMECSALLQSGLSEVFNDAVNAVLNPMTTKTTKKGKKCIFG